MVESLQAPLNSSTSSLFKCLHNVFKQVFLWPLTINISHEWCNDVLTQSCLPSHTQIISPFPLTQTVCTTAHGTTCLQILPRQSLRDACADADAEAGSGGSGIDTRSRRHLRDNHSPSNPQRPKLRPTTYTPCSILTSIQKEHHHHEWT